MKKFILAAALSLSSYFSSAQATGSPNEIQKVTRTLMHYIEGTANGEPDRLSEAFHEDFNLYTVAGDSLLVRSGKQYISQIKKGEKTKRIGRIVSIDIEGDAAMAKAEIVVPNWRIFTDYFLLLKYKGHWKIVQKSYAWREYPKTEK